MFQWNRLSKNRWTITRLLIPTWFLVRFDTAPILAPFQSVNFKTSTTISSWNFEVKIVIFQKCFAERKIRLMDFFAESNVKAISVSFRMGQTARISYAGTQATYTVNPSLRMCCVFLRALPYGNFSGVWEHTPTWVLWLESDDEAFETLRVMKEKN